MNENIASSIITSSSLIDTNTITTNNNNINTHSSFISIPTTLKFTNDGYGSKEIYYPNINPKYEYLDCRLVSLEIIRNH